MSALAFSIRVANDECVAICPTKCADRGVVVAAGARVRSACRRPVRRAGPFPRVMLGAQPYSETKWFSTAVHTSCWATGSVHVAR